MVFFLPPQFKYIYIFISHILVFQFLVIYICWRQNHGNMNYMILTLIFYWPELHDQSWIHWAATSAELQYENQIFIQFFFKRAGENRFGGFPSFLVGSGTSNIFFHHTSISIILEMVVCSFSTAYVCVFVCLNILPSDYLYPIILLKRRHAFPKSETLEAENGAQHLQWLEQSEVSVDLELMSAQSSITH